MSEEKKSHIIGIYNYCDRWCEKCSFTDRCLVFTQESKIISHEIMNDGELPDLEDIMKDLPDFEDEDELFEGDFDEDDFFDPADDLPNDDYEEKFKEMERRVDNHPLTKMGNDYFEKSDQLLKELHNNYDFYNLIPEKIEDEKLKLIYPHFETVAYYHTFIYVKIKRALSGKEDLNDEFDDDLKDAASSDMNGTAKVVAISLNNSIAALNNLFNLLSKYEDQLEELMILAGKLLNLLEVEFPDYKNFIRPGFDESEK